MKLLGNSPEGNRIKTRSEMHWATYCSVATSTPKGRVFQFLVKEQRDMPASLS